MEPLISVRGLCRSFSNGQEVLVALRDLDLDIYPGEMVAIIGASGSGKSTLMNILGCLDRPSLGNYRFSGRSTSDLDADELAELRREHFGFIFQHYQLLPDLSALENVEVPAIYAGRAPVARRDRAMQLLERLRLGDRLASRPSQLSGGQQQRVSVARALMNGGEVILADEPTGALDSKSGKELIVLLHELNAEGHTIIVVTHDAAIAAEASRIIEIKDGRIISDRRGAEAKQQARPIATKTPEGPMPVALFQSVEAFAVAIRALRSHKLRTFLTMLGIIIGIASVVGVVALGQGSQQAVLTRISSIGTDTISIQPGSGFGDRNAGSIHTLSEADVAELERQPFADSVTPTVSAATTVLVDNISASAQVTGVGQDYFQVNGRTITQGNGFDKADITSFSQVAVIDPNAVSSLFPNGGDPVGQEIILGSTPVRVVGVVTATSSFGPGGSSISIWVPYTTLMARMTGQDYLSGITIRVADDYDIAEAQAEISAILTRRHGTTDFYLQNSNTIRDTITSTSQTLTLLVAAIAVISLIVGGIGVMNIMLVSVTERTQEIGVRMAVGARRGDILRQFLIEAVLVCLVGGVVGIGLAFGAGRALQLFVNTTLSYSGLSIVLAFLSSSLIGVAFGFMPARAASRLDPLEALARD